MPRETEPTALANRMIDRRRPRETDVVTQKQKGHPPTETQKTYATGKEALPLRHDRGGEQLERKSKKEATVGSSDIGSVTYATAQFGLGGPKRSLYPVPPRTPAFAFE